MMDSLNNHYNQLDLKRGHTAPTEVIEWLQRNSIKVEHLLDERPQFSRWWFMGSAKLVEAILLLQRKCPEMEYRWLCVRLGALVMQQGRFDSGAIGLEEWFRTVPRPSTRLVNILRQMCLKEWNERGEDISPMELTWADFNRAKGAGKRSWEEFELLRNLNN